MTAIAPAPDVDLVAVARHAAYALDQRRRTNLVLCALAAALVIPVAGFLVAPEISGLWAVTFLALLVAAKARALHGDLQLARRAAATVDGVDIDRRLGENRLRRSQERRLAEANTADLCVYATRKRSVPRPGSAVEDTVLPSPSTSPATPTGTWARCRRPGSWITCSGRCRATCAPARSPRPRRRRRGPVRQGNGGPAPRSRGAGRDRGAPPVRAADLVADTADHPSRLSRTCLRVQVVGHGGQVVTSLDVAAVEARHLSVDLAIHALRPVHRTHHVADCLPRTRAALLWKLAVRWRRWPSTPAPAGASSAPPSSPSTP
ncbi:MAG TPA: hypothetical protein VIL48_12965 [Acidimicrobiales bacterium]